jgi:CheY-like chemotaxis protein
LIPTTNALRPVAPTPRILVVDADDDTRAFYRQSLQLSGYDVVEASDGRDALTKALVGPPSLVVTELGLPLLDGYALCEILRRDRATADTPILVVTSEARPAELDRARKAGADVVIAKPTTSEHILSETQRLLADAKDLREHCTVLVKSHSRFTTTTPPASPPSLICPSCDRPLAYDRSHIGGVSERQPEQWDYYTCPACGAFQYRQRTRKLRRVDSVL